MSKEELFKKYQEIVLKTNGGNDDYVVALCQISNLIKDFAEEQDKQLAELKAENTELREMYKSADRINKTICETDIYPLQEENEQLKAENEKLESELDWERRNKICIVKQLDDPKSYVSLEDYRKLKEENERLEEENKKVKLQLNDTVKGNKNLLEELKSEEKEGQEISNFNLKLKQQLKEKDETIKQQENHIVGQNVINNELKKKLKAKDEEIGWWKENWKIANKHCMDNTKQVCKKIRKLWKEQAIYYHICDSGQELKNKTYQCTILGMNEILFNNMIKQIEKGENNE